ncbi:MAG: insulinase family protein [Candidatus Schekmanbacteria bacterium]|nr:insulinase family protein [Candidatus Schekmanbacteria bacterium]
MNKLLQCRLASFIIGLVLIAPKTIFARPLNSTTSVLENGLKVILVEEHKAPIVVFQIWYNAGGKDEVTGKTGLSHLLEHMMFKGTANHGKGEFSRIVARKGGHENAFTGTDYTAYFEKFASDRLELSLQLESDRMQNLLLDPKETALETKVVQEERRTRTDDDPTSAAFEEMYAAAFKVHPYHNPVIGWMSDLDGISRDDLANHYKTWYAPNNSVIVVAGDFDSQNLLPKIREYFGKIPKGTIPAARKIVEPVQKGQRRVTVKRKAHLPFMIMGYHVPNLTSPDSYPLAILAGILSGGKSTRLYQELVYKQQLALNAGANYDRVSEDPNLFYVYASPQPGKDVNALEQEIYKQLDLFKTELVSDEELQRAKNQVEAHFIFAQDSVFYQAMQIGELETIGVDHHYLEEFVEKIRLVTKEDVQRVAQKYLSEDNRTVSTLIPLADKK